MAHGHGASARRGQQRGTRFVQVTEVVHPRVCVSGISTWNQSLVEDLALYEELGIHTIGVATRKIESEDDIARVRSSGLMVANVIGVGQAGLAHTIAEGMDHIGIVQVSDFAVGTLSTPNRLVPGDGDIPLRRITDQLLDAGYEGVFDLELVGPKIEEEGYRGAIARSCAYLSDLLS